MTHLTIDGIRIEHAWYGERTAAPPLVFLHEGLGCAGQWRDFPARVSAATGLPAFVYSRAGYGGSAPIALPRPLTYMQDEAATFLPRLLDAAGITRSILIGHSDGASIALVAAAVHPQRILGLILEAPHVFRCRNKINLPS